MRGRRKFYTAISWTINPLFTDDNAACIVIDENLFLMVQTRDFFSTLTDKPVVDPRAALQVETALSRNSREEVDAFPEKVIVAGGTEHRAAQNHGFMYARDFEDPDGNLFSAP